MALTIVVRSGDNDSPPTISFDAPRIVIGRGEGCDIRLPDPSVSHRHASIRQRGSEYIVLDEGSTNGTCVGPVRLPPHTPRVLRSSDLIRIGRVWLEVRLEHVPPTPQPQLATKELALALVAGALRAEGQPGALRVTVFAGPDAGATLDLAEQNQPYVLGRGKGIALPLEDPDASRRHAELTRRGGKLFVRDLGSKNGTRLGDDPLEPEREVPWKPGLHLMIGADVFEYEDPVAEALRELEAAADEKLDDREPIDAPVGADEPELPDAAPRGGVLGDTPGAAPGTAAPLPSVNRRTAPPPRGKPGWRPLDYLIAAVALLVLGSSVLGMFWLFGAE
jgi:pSer/pThr/pTyr-binding forkhead associated (FHA) protein